MRLLAALCAIATLVSGLGTLRAETAVLDTVGSWRIRETLAPPVILSEGVAKPLLFGKTWLEASTPDGIGNAWTQADFDDSGWLRGPATAASCSPYISRLRIRGKFTVTDPEAVKGLTISASCFGGAAVYVNGKEIARAHLPPDGSGLAEPYPDDAFVDEKGNNLGEQSGEKKPSEETLRRIALRTRTLDAPVPPGVLRKGLNVVAVDIVRAPYSGVMEKFRDVFDHPSVKRMLQTRELPAFVELKWGTCAVKGIRLTAASADGLVPDASRPKGLAAWNSDVLWGDYDLDIGSAAEALRPIRIAGTPNGSFSGKLMVGSGGPIKGLRSTVSDLHGPGVIPAGAVRVRYGIPWGEDASSPQLYPVRPVLLGALSETPPTEIPVRTAPATRAPTPVDAVRPLFGAVTSVWVTVDVPASAKPGRYKGELTVRADGEAPVKCPVTLDLEGWVLPPTQEYRTWVEMIESPDTLVAEYGVERWSDRHFELIGRAMDHLNRIGSRVVYIPVICRTNLGNEESMVRWIHKPDGSWDWDFSVMERYLDLAEKRMGRPKVVCLWVWEKFMFPSPEAPVTYGDRPTTRPNDNPGGTNDEIRDYIGKGPRITVIDPKTGTRKTEFLPYLLAPESKPIWRAFFAEARKRIERRGLADVMMLGTPSDITLRKDHFAFYNDVAPGIPWVSQTHMNHKRIFEAGGARLGYYATVFDVGFAVDPDEGRRHGWQTPDLHAHLLRNWGLDTDYFPLVTWRHMTELNVAGNQRGIGHLGADFWSVVKGRRGARLGRIYEKFPECNWRSNDVCTSLLAPGPDGPVATARYEMMREGVQECEARIFIERALTDEALRAKLGPDLAARCQSLLDERTRDMIRGISSLELTGYWRQLAPLATHPSGGWWNKPGVAGNAWFIGSGWQDRTQQLFSAAAEVTRALGEKPAK